MNTLETLRAKLSSLSPREAYAAHSQMVEEIIRKKVSDADSEAAQEARQNARCWTYDHFRKKYSIGCNTHELVKACAGLGCLRAWSHTYGRPFNLLRQQAEANWEPLPDGFEKLAGLEALQWHIADLPADLQPLAERIVYQGIGTIRYCDAQEVLPRLRQALEAIDETERGGPA